MVKYDEVLIVLRQIIWVIDFYFCKLSKVVGFIVLQLLILQVIDVYGEMIMGDIVIEVFVSQVIVIIIFDWFEKCGLIEWKRGEWDKCWVYVYLIIVGCDIMEWVLILLQEEFMDCFLWLQDWEQLQIFSFLQCVVVMMNVGDIDVLLVFDLGVIDCIQFVVEV